MNDAEAIMWAVEADPFLRSDFMNITLLAARPDPDRLRAGLERAFAAFPPLRQRVVRPPFGLAPPVWADDPDFDLLYHVRRVAVPPPGGFRQLLDLAATLAATPLDRARPLWELTIVEGLEGGRSAVLQQVHHSLSDGVGGMRLFRMLLQRTPVEAAAPGDPAQDVELGGVPQTGEPNPLVWRHPEIFSPDDTRPSPLDGWLDHPHRTEDPDGSWPMLDRFPGSLGDMRGALAYRFGQAVGATRRGLELSAALPLRSTDELRLLAERVRRTARSVADQVVVRGGALSPLMVGRSLARHFEAMSLDLSAVREAGRILGGGRNAVFVAGVTGALLAYHDRMGAPCEALRMVVPVSLRSGTAPLGGNHFAPARVVVPLGPKDPAERLLVVQAALEDVAAEPGVSLAEGLAGVISLLPPALLIPALRAQARTVDFATSIVPGLRSGRWLAGARVEGSWPMGPRVGCALNATMLACGDRLDLGVNLDPAAVTDPSAFMDCLRGSFADLLDLPA